MEKVQIEHAVRVHGDMLYRLALIRLKNQEDAQDIVQQTFLKLMIHHSKLESDLIDWNSAFSTTSSAEEHALKNLQLQQLWQAVARLPDRYRTVLHLNYMENYTPKEIADILHLSYNTVCVRLTRAKKQLSLLLEQEDFQ